MWFDKTTGEPVKPGGAQMIADGVDYDPLNNNP
jgi:hypothetical protein